MNASLLNCLEFRESDILGPLKSKEIQEIEEHFLRNVREIRGQQSAILMCNDVETCVIVLSDT